MEVSNETSDKYMFCFYSCIIIYKGSVIVYTNLKLHMMLKILGQWHLQLVTVATDIDWPSSPMKSCTVLFAGSQHAFDPPIENKQSSGVLSM